MKIAILQDVASTVIAVSKESQQVIKAVNRLPQGEQTVATRFDMVTVCPIFASDTSPQAWASTQLSMLISLLLSADCSPLVFYSSFHLAKARASAVSCYLLWDCLELEKEEENATYVKVSSKACLETFLSSFFYRVRSITSTSLFPHFELVFDHKFAGIWGGGQRSYQFKGSALFLLWSNLQPNRLERKGCAKRFRRCRKCGGKDSSGSCLLGEKVQGHLGGWQRCVYQVILLTAELPVKIST